MPRKCKNTKSIPIVVAAPQYGEMGNQPDGQLHRCLSCLNLRNRNQGEEIGMLDPAHIGSCVEEDKLPFCVDFSSVELPFVVDGRARLVDITAP